MATSGSFETSGYSDSGWPDRLVFSWELSSQSIEGNYSVISYSVYATGGTNGYRYTQFHGASLNVAGNSYSDDGGYAIYNGTTIFSGSVTVYHDSDGDGSFSASLSAAIYAYATNSSGSGSWTLPTIPRASSISSISNNGMVINGSNALTVNISRKSSSFTHRVTFTFGSKSMTYTEQTTACSFVVPLSWVNEIASVDSGYGTVTVQTYSGSTAVGSSVSSGFTLKSPGSSSISSVTSSIVCNGSSAIAVGISKSDSNFTHNVTWKFGAYSYTTKGVSTSTSYKIPTSWLNAIPNANSGVGSVVVDTYNGNTKIGSSVSKNFVLSVPSYTPSLGSVSIAKVQPSSISTWSIFVQYKTGAKITFNSYAGLYGSSIKEFKMVIDGVSYTSTTKTITISQFASSGTLSYTATVTDTRNKTKSIAGSIVVEQLVSPSYVSSSIYRYNGTAKDDEGTQLYFKFDFSYKDYGGLNKTTCKIYLKDQNANSYTEYGTFSNGVAKIISDKTFSITIAYTVKVVVTDLVGTVLTYFVDIPTSYAIIDISNTGDGLGLLRMNSKSGYVQVGGHVDIDKSLNTVGGASFGGAVRCKETVLIGDDANGSPLNGYILQASGGTALFDGDVSITGMTKLSNNVNISGVTNITAKFTVQGDTFYSRAITGAGNSAMWYYLGILEMATDGANAIIDVYSGNGSGTGAAQNTHIRITIKNVKQSTQSATNAFITTYEVYGDDFGYSSNNVKVQVRAYNHSSCKVYIYFPWGNWNGHYNVHGRIDSWSHRGTCISSAPTTDTAQTVRLKSATFYEIAHECGFKCIYGDEFTLNSTRSACYFGYRTSSGYEPINTWKFYNGSGDFGTVEAKDFGNMSDKKHKIDLKDISKAVDFVLNLKPYDYQFDNGTRRHMGFLAQDVSELCKELDMGDMAIYAASKFDEKTGKYESYFDDTTDDEHLSWTLRYTEFIAPMIATIQKQQKEIDELKERMSTLIEQVSILQNEK